MKKIVWTIGLILLAAGMCSAQTVLYFPQYVDGAQNLSGDVGWVTALVITNPAAPGTAVANGTVTLTQDNGTPLNLQLLDENNTPVGKTFQIAGGQTKFFISPASDRPQPFSSGYATVTSDLPVSGGLVFLEANSRGTFATAGVPAASALTRQASIVVVFHENSGDNGNTGVAVVNPGSSTATLTFQLLDKSGVQIVAPVTRTLAANNHTAFFVPELFPSAPANIFGTMRITSDRPIASIALQFFGPTFGTIPIIPLP